MSDVRSVTITGGAVVDYSGEAVKKRGGSRKKKQEGGVQQGVDTYAAPVGGPHVLGYQGQPSNPVIKVDTTAPLYPVAPVAPVAPAAPAAPVASVNAPLAPVHTSQSGGTSYSNDTQQQQHGGSTKQIKVELKKKAPSRKVQLNPKRAEAPAKKKPQTKKIRKITLGVSSLHKRMTRAKKVHKRVKDMPIDKLREHLVAKKWIKATSKAPEAVLRQIAADSQIVAKKVL